MDWVKSKTGIVAICCLAVVGVQGYMMSSMRDSMEERVSSIEANYADLDEKLTMLTSDLSAVTKRIGNTMEGQQEAQAQSSQLKQENAQLAKRLRRELAAKADSKTVMKLQEEATRLSAVHQDTSTKIDGITGEVLGVRTDLDATRSDLRSTRSDLDMTREELANSRRDLGGLIARNSTELADLRRKGERDYIEFDISKSKDFKRVADILVQLKKTDVKRQKFEVSINADDNPIQKKDRTANEPVTFLVGRDRVRYELVVNKVDKDRIRGYISAPKDHLTGAEAPSVRVQ
jgi:chromosome segregation ATPase